jgi:hypothetical protein
MTARLTKAGNSPARKQPSRPHMERDMYVTDRPRTFLPGFSVTRDDDIWHPDLLRLSLPSR